LPAAKSRPGGLLDLQWARRTGMLCPVTEPLARTFDAVAEQYERARPSYPARLFDDLKSLAGLRGRAAVRVV
jgi:hypothetical protein